MELYQDDTNKVDRFNSELRKIGFSHPGIEYIQIYKHPELNDLESSAEVIVIYKQGRRRFFTLDTFDRLERICADRPCSIYTTGLPFVIVDEIVPETVVKAVYAYLISEEDAATGCNRNVEVHQLYDIKLLESGVPSENG